MLTSENYFSPEMQMEYLSSSQYRDFVGTIGKRGCEAMATAVIRGEWEIEQTTAMLIGSYVDAHFEGTLDTFKAQNPDCFKKDGGLKAGFTQAEEIINMLEKDEYFMKYMSGEKQVIMTAEFFGTKWKCKIDSLGDCFITDLKIMAELRKAHWAKDYGHMSFVEFWGYDIQAAIYQKIHSVNEGKTLPFFIAAASKEKVPDKEIIGFRQQDLNNTMSIIESNMPRILDLKSGKADPDPCGVCDYCKSVKVLTGPVHYSELILKP